MEPIYLTRDKRLLSKWSVSPLTEISGRALPAGLSAEATSTKEPEQKRHVQQYRRGQLP